MDKISEDVKPAAMPPVLPKFKVAKPFNTANRRFKPGDDIAAEDLAGAPFDLAHMADRKRGFIVPT